LERVLAAIFAPREYAPLKQGVQELALQRAAAHLGRPITDLDGETVFQTAFHPARAVPDTAARLSAFINQYGLCRNIAFVGLIATGLLVYSQTQAPSNETAWLIAGAAALTIGMFGRFLKFYAAYSSDVLRTYASPTVTP
jgi:hypothetical protein